MMKFVTLAALLLSGCSTLQATQEALDEATGRVIVEIKGCTELPTTKRSAMKNGTTVYVYRDSDCSEYEFNMDQSFTVTLEDGRSLRSYLHDTKVMLEITK